MSRSIAVALAGVAALVYAGTLIHGFRSGTMTALGKYSWRGQRREEPERFWGAAAFNAFCMIVGIWAAIGLSLSRR